MPRVAISADIIKIVTGLLKQSLNTQDKLKEIEIMYQNAIYISTSWYSKICWFLVKKCWCQQYSRDVSCYSYVYFFVLLLLRCNFSSSFIIVGYVWQILGKGAFLPPPGSVSRPEKAHSGCVRKQTLNNH